MTSNDKDPWASWSGAEGFSVEIERDDSEASDEDKWLVRVLGWTAISRPGEVEEALDTLEERKRVSMYMSFSLSAVRLHHFHPSKRTIALIIQIFLYINGLA